jgi:hypothetical protein
MKKENNGLATRAMIVRLAIGRWYGTVTDRASAREFAQQKHAKEHMVHLRKHVISPKALLEINSVTNEARAVHNELTLPWTDGGYRILSSDGYFQYMEKLRPLHEQFTAAVETFIPKFEEWYNQSEEDLGGLFRKHELPTSGEQLRRRFYFDMRVYPLPQAADFRVALNNQDVSTIRSSIEADLKATISQSMQEPWRRLHDAVAHMIERLNADKGFRNSVTDNMRELVDVIPLLNITGDRKLADMAKNIGDSLLVDPGDVRDSKKLRNQTAEEATKILRKLEAFI